MKFLKSEYDAFRRIIEETGHAYDKFSFVKKRGKLNVKQKDWSNEFVFFRKKESILNENQQFEDKITYILGNNDELILSTWEDVESEFKKWLRSPS